MKNFKKQYRELETQVFAELRSLIDKSEYLSKHTSEKAIKVNVFDFTELTIVNDKLTFLCDSGLHYSVFTDVTLEDLIDIISHATQNQ